MAKITLGKKREQESSYRFYKQASERGEIIVVRRKVAMPSDVEHRSSRATKRQRELFGSASKRWASIPSVVKPDLRKKYGLVDAQTPHGLSEIKVLQGAQLFTSQEIHQEKYHDEHLSLPPWLCFILTDELGKPLDLEAKLRLDTDGLYSKPPGYYLGNGNTLFYPVTPGIYAYQYGYTYHGIFGRQIYRCDWDGIQKVRYVTVMPYVSCHIRNGYRIWCLPPGQGFEPALSSGSPYLWSYHIHQQTGEAWYQFLPWVAYTLQWKKIRPDIFTITITLGQLVRNDRVMLGYGIKPPIIWDIIYEGPGLYHLKPPQQTCRYHIAPWGILGYED